MGVKIDTKAYFKVLTVNGAGIYANMAELLEGELWRQSETVPRHLIVVLDKFAEVPEQLLNTLNAFAEHMAAERLSFVVTGMRPTWGGKFREAFPGLNAVNTYEEAVDLVMMEELERELQAGEGSPEAQDT